MHIFRERKKIGHTYAKYFLSYFIIVTILFFGFFFIMKRQLVKYNSDQISEQSKLQLDNIAEQLDNELVYLSQVDNSLVSNANLIKSRYKEKRSNQYPVYLELTKYVSSTKLIRAIAYMPKNSYEVLSTKYFVEYTDDVFCITEQFGKNLTFDPAPYFNNTSGQLAFVSDEDMQCLIYFPPLDTNAPYIFFYILDLTDLYLQMKTLTNAETSAIALIDANKQIVTGVNTSALTPHLESIELKNGIYKVNSSITICVHTGIANGFSIISQISNDYLLQQIRVAFTSSYLALLLLSAIGFLLILFAMKITYLPLHKLTLKIIPNSDLKQGYLEQLDYAFSEVQEQNHLLKNKLDNYRLSMQKSLLDSVITSRLPKDANNSNIDQFFDPESNKEIFVIRMASPAAPFPAANIQQFWSKMLPGNDTCMILDSKPDSAVFLINYIGTESNKAEVLKELLNNFYEEQEYLSVISKGSDSPLDIPSLYANAIHASNYWPQIPVVDCKSLHPTSQAFTYPYDKLNQLSKSLMVNQYTVARLLVNDIFGVIEQSNQPQSILPDFFVRCVLIDMLTVIINCMNQSNIKFKSYNDLCFETLYFCRSCSYAEKSEEIKANTGKLLDFYEKEISSKTVHSEQIKQQIEKCYCQPDFSIFMLADTFQVSTAYMSYLVKINLGQNFSDYLWKLRLEKAKKLLKSSDMTIDEISNTVGYFTASSFRRKFKQETGLTPSQYRSREAAP